MPLRRRRAVETQVIERFIECGDPHHGFARIYCDACGHNYLLAYSSQTRYFCPSCHEKPDCFSEELPAASSAHHPKVKLSPSLGQDPSRLCYPKTVLFEPRRISYPSPEPRSNERFGR